MDIIHFFSNEPAKGSVCLFHYPLLWNQINNVAQYGDEREMHERK